MIEAIIQQSNLSPELFDLFYENMEVFELKKGEHVVREGHKCNHLFLVESGLMRVYYHDEKGHDITHWFSEVGQVTTVPDSFFENVDNQFNIEALEDSQLRGVTLETLNTMCAKEHAFEHFARLMAIRFLSEINDKLISLQFKTAKQRYLALLEKHPDIFQRVNLGHIASYIGITQQSLSRIRAEV